MSDDFSKGDWTIEGFLPATRPVREWTHFKMSRGGPGSKTVTHTHEEFEGVLFSSVRVYGSDGKLEQVQLTRADLVSGQSSGP